MTRAGHLERRVAFFFFSYDSSRPQDSQLNLVSKGKGKLRFTSGVLGAGSCGFLMGNPPVGSRDETQAEAP